MKGLLSVAGAPVRSWGGILGNCSSTRKRVRKSKLWTSARDSMWLRVMAPQRVVTKVCGSTVWLVVGSACPLGMGWFATDFPGGSLGRGRILVSRLKRTVAALAAGAAGSGGVGAG